MQKTQQNEIYWFVFYLGLALILYSLESIDKLKDYAFLKYIFKPIEVFFHESSHLLSALLTGGNEISLHLKWDSGHVRYMTTGGIGATITSFVGYFGASLWGFMLYASSIYASKGLKVFLMFYIGFFVFFTGDFHTLIMIGFIFAIISFCWVLRDKGGARLIQFISVYIMVASIYSPTYLWAYSDTGDHVSMAEKTFIPSFIWIILWFLLGLMFIYFSFKVSLKASNTESN